MAKPIAWKCYVCNHIGPTEEFRNKDGHTCPKCQSEDVFPHRLYKCKACGKIQDQNFWFPEFDLDTDPFSRGRQLIPAIPCEKCRVKLEKRVETRVKKRKTGWTEEDDRELREFSKRSAELQEVPVELPVRTR